MHLASNLLKYWGPFYPKWNCFWLWFWNVIMIFVKIEIDRMHCYQYMNSMQYQCSVIENDFWFGLHFCSVKLSIVWDPKSWPIRPCPLLAHKSSFLARYMATETMAYGRRVVHSCHQMSGKWPRVTVVNWWMIRSDLWCSWLWVVKDL